MRLSVPCLSHCIFTACDSGVAMHIPIIRKAAFCSGSALGAAAAFAATFSAVALAAPSAGGGMGLSDMMWCVINVVVLPTRTKHRVSPKSCRWLSGEIATRNRLRCPASPSPSPSLFFVPSTSTLLHVYLMPPGIHISFSLVLSSSETSKYHELILICAVKPHDRPDVKARAIRLVSHRRKAQPTASVLRVYCRQQMQPLIQM